MDLMTEKATCHELMACSVDASIACLKLVHQAVGDRPFAWGVAADDSGTPRGEFVKPVLWGGGCDRQSVLNHASPDAVREHVRERLRLFGAGGGYVFDQVHNIQANVPPANVVAMLDAAFEFGGV